MVRPAPPTASTPLHVSLLALPDAVVSTLAGILDVMNGAALMGLGGPGAQPPFRIEVVGEKKGPLMLASGVPFEVQRAVDEVPATDIAIVPSVLLAREGWRPGRYPKLVEWLRRMHEKGAMLCSACSGIFLLAETELFDGKDATVHFGYAREFQALYPRVPIHPERVLVISGLREELVCSGASTTWHDLVLYLTARHAGATLAQEVARQFALQWHQDGLAPYIVFEGRSDHGDAEIASAQQWLGRHFSVANPVEEMIKRSSLAERTFKRRFAAATGLAPIAYVQRLRIEDAKRRLERTDASVDEISWRVGYAWATKTRRSSAACSSAPPAWRRAPTAGASASRNSRGPEGVCWAQPALAAPQAAKTLAIPGPCATVFQNHGSEGMSMGGDFYALSDDQLKQLLAGELAYADFLSKGPRECLSRFEPLWYELSQVLAEEEGCGREQSQVIPELCSFSYSQHVAETARKLEKLDEATVLGRCDSVGAEAPAAEVWGAVKEVIAFYRRAADNKDAVLFRVT